MPDRHLRHEINIIDPASAAVPFAPAAPGPPLVCVNCGCLVENSVAAMQAHGDWHLRIRSGGINA